MLLETTQHDLETDFVCGGYYRINLTNTYFDSSNELICWLEGKSCIRAEIKLHLYQPQLLSFALDFWWNSIKSCVLHGFVVLGLLGELYQTGMNVLQSLYQLSYTCISSPLGISVVFIVFLTVLRPKKKLIQGEGNTPDFFNMERDGFGMYCFFFLF